MEDFHGEQDDERLTKAAVRSLGDNPEQQLAAVRFLRSIRCPGSDGGEGLIRRWQEVDARPGRSMLAWWLGLGVLLISLAAGWVSQPAILIVADQLGFVVDPFGQREAALTRTAARMKEEDRFRVFGNDETSGSVNGRKAVWLARPEDASLYAAFVASYLGDSSKLPDEYQETTRRIDPENAWFRYLEAAVEGRESVDKNPGKRTGTKDGAKREPDAWTIVDEERFRASIDHLRQASSLPEYRNYRLENLQATIGVLPIDTFEAQVDSSACLASFSLADIIQLRVIGDLISASAFHAAEKGDREEMKRVLHDAERFLRSITQGKCSTALEGMVEQLLVGAISTSLGAETERLGMEDEAKRWDAVTARLQTMRDAVKNRRLVVDGKPQSWRVCGMFFGDAALSLSIRVENPPPLTDRDLRPGRQIDHLLVAIGCSLMCLVLSGLAMLVFWLYQFRAPLMIRRLSRRMSSLLEVEDWLWIVAGGLLLPVIWVAAIALLTPWGGQGFGLLGNFMLLPTCHFLAILLGWWLLPPLVARVRLAKRAGELGFKHPSAWDWGGIVCLVAFVPAIGAGVVHGVPDFQLIDWWLERMFQRIEVIPGSSLGFYLAVALCGVVFIMIAVRGFVALVGMRKNPLGAAVIGRVMVPVCAVALVLSALGMMTFDAVVARAFRQEQPFKMDARFPGWTRYEYEVANRMRGEVREILGFSE